MKTLSGIYKGNLMIEMDENIQITKNIKVIILPEQDDDEILQNQFQNNAEITFGKL